MAAKVINAPNKVHDGRPDKLYLRLEIPVGGQGTMVQTKRKRRHARRSRQPCNINEASLRERGLNTLLEALRIINAKDGPHRMRLAMNRYCRLSKGLAVKK